MKYILLLILTFPILAETYEETEFAKEKKDNPTKTVEPDKEASKTSTESKDNTNLTQAEIRKKRKLEIGLGYGEGKDKLSHTVGIINLNLQYNLTSRFSIGYSHLHKQKFSTSPYLNPFLNFSILEKTNSLEVGLLNLRYYFFEKFPLYITGGVGRDYVSHYKTVEYQYGYLDYGSFRNDPVIREVNSPLANYTFLGFGFQWIFQNGFFIGVEQTILQTRYTYRGNYLILNKNQYTVEGIRFEAFVNSGYQEIIKTNLSNIRLGYSLQF